jgi:class 3 adenylate cyclase/pimeloyl-ACP methyl ester carboxylesterase
MKDAAVDLPETSYAKTTDGVHIAYQVVGDGPVDFVYVSPWVSNVEFRWTGQLYAAYLRGLASFSRLIVFDKRGLGLSDPVAPDRLPPAETRMDDIRAVMDAAGSDRAVIYGASESGAMAMLFAATYPERTVALVVHGSYPSLKPDAPWGESAEEHEALLRDIEEHWATEDFIRRGFGTTVESDPSLTAWMASYFRHSMSPAAAVAAARMEYETDVRAILPAIHVPTLILHREADNPEAHRYIADHIPDATLKVLPGTEHLPFLGDKDSVVRAIDSFIESIHAEEAELSRVLCTVLFTDIVDSTTQSATMGDRRWREVVDEHDRIVRGQIARYQGHEIKTMGDGFLATFDGPARAIRAASASTEAVKRLGIEIRAGLHTGECEILGEDVGGIGVAIGARVGAVAGPSEVLVSQTVKDLVIGSGLIFEDAGEHELKGVPDRWHLYRAHR